ncbi:DUF5004 domain-containing protein [Segetibacter sp. 3557_3]|uniref:DUF5004 domain-containing protein n=1 Tax=Segetibacter sp. 3557_3 TaxID=2547429 RepID=UPI00105898D8|nr:DUF5004 domain-containing protein [Segetibacter sp. 3557_3]TDH25135.1 DUF5004 domain-containing protein [Segetibacter sp. 3557_3]
MKTSNKPGFFIATAMVLLYACQPEQYKSVGLPNDNVSMLAGTWKLNKVIQTDEDSKRKGFPYQQLDLTTLFPYRDFVLKLDANGSAPSTFSTTPGNSPRIIRLASGNWLVDDPAYPKVLTLASATDTARVTLGAYPTGITPVLKITRERRDSASNRLIMSYSYEFTKQ